jgi:hypothetical protein
MAAVSLLALRYFLRGPPRNLSAEQRRDWIHVILSADVTFQCRFPRLAAANLFHMFAAQAKAAVVVAQWAAGFPVGAYSVYGRPLAASVREFRRPPLAVINRGKADIGHEGALFEH